MRFAEITLESHSKVAATTGVPELYVLVRPPSDALLYQIDCDPGAIGMHIIKLQSV